MKKSTLLALVLFSPVLAAALYVGGMLLFGTLTDFKPPEQQDEVIRDKASAEADSSFSFLIWNIGYSGLGDKSDFFYDGGEMVHPEQSDFESYFAGIYGFIEKQALTDIILLQEVDLSSARSYRLNQYKELDDLLLAHSSSFGINYKVRFVPVPYTEPLGQVMGGLASFSRFPISEAKRFQFPGNFSWPKRLFMLDRCFLLTRIPLKNGRDLVVINSHNSAYDDGTLKQKQMEYLRSFLLEEYELGNYVVVGADWNQCPPGFDRMKFSKTEGEEDRQSSIEADFMPEGWQWVYDDEVPTNRKLESIYDPKETFTTVIDFYLISPNLELKSIEGVNLDFAYSDHQPVRMELKLKQK